MYQVESYLTGNPDIQVIDTVELEFDVRKKSRFLGKTQSGKELKVILPRGHVLQCGDLLLTESKQAIKVIAAKEHLSCASCDSSLLLIRIAYHLGNRHVPLQIEADALYYQHDHVLDDMIKGLGGTVTSVNQAFQPEDGAYQVGLGAGHHHHD